MSGSSDRHPLPFPPRSCGWAGLNIVGELCRERSLEMTDAGRQPLGATEKGHHAQQSCLCGWGSFWQGYACGGGAATWLYCSADSGCATCWGESQGTGTLTPAPACTLSTDGTACRPDLGHSRAESRAVRCVCQLGRSRSGLRVPTWPCTALRTPLLPLGHGDPCSLCPHCAGHSAQLPSPGLVPVSYGRSSLAGGVCPED